MSLSKVENQIEPVKMQSDILNQIKNVLKYVVIHKNISKQLN